MTKQDVYRVIVVASWTYATQRFIELASSLSMELLTGSGTEAPERPAPPRHWLFCPGAGA